MHFESPPHTADPLASLTLPTTVELTGVARPVTRLLRQICEQYTGGAARRREGRSLCEAWLQEALQRVFAAAFRQGGVQYRDPPNASDWYRGMTAKLEAQLTDPGLTVGALAAQVGLSQRHFTRRFRQHAGITPKRMILRRRIELACELLCHHPGMPVREVSAACGFEDPYHFSTQFKRHTGVPPSTYRTGAQGHDRGDVRPSGASLRSAPA